MQEAHEEREAKAEPKPKIHSAPNPFAYDRGHPNFKPELNPEKKKPDASHIRRGFQKPKPVVDDANMAWMEEVLPGMSSEVCLGLWDGSLSNRA